MSYRALGIVLCGLQLYYNMACFASLLQLSHHVPPKHGVYAELLWRGVLCVLEPRWALHSSWRGR